MKVFFYCWQKSMAFSFLFVSFIAPRCHVAWASLKFPGQQSLASSPGLFLPPPPKCQGYRHTSHLAVTEFHLHLLWTCVMIRNLLGSPNCCDVSWESSRLPPEDGTTDFKAYCWSSPGAPQSSMVLKDEVHDETMAGAHFIRPLLGLQLPCLHPLVFNPCFPLSCCFSFILTPELGYSFPACSLSLDEWSGWNLNTSNTLGFKAWIK